MADEFNKITCVFVTSQEEEVKSHLGNMKLF